MLLIGIDTSGKSGGVTLAEGDERSFRVIESSEIAGGRFSAQLVPTIAALLEKHRLTVQEIGGLAVASGPGSFTGLRVGLSAVKGLAEVLGTPIATVSLLEALAIASGRRSPIAAALDAGRGEIFFGLCQVAGEESVATIESLLSPDEFLERVSDQGIELFVTSDESVAGIVHGARPNAPIARIQRPGSDWIARIGLRKLLAGVTVSVEALDANYLRRSDAEIFSKGPR